MNNNVYECTSKNNCQYKLLPIINLMNNINDFSKLFTIK